MEIPETNEPATWKELLRAEQILKQIQTDMEIDFQIRGLGFSRAEMIRHMRHRNALGMSRLKLIDKSEQIHAKLK